MVKNGILGKNSTLVDFHFFSYATAYRDAANLSKLLAFKHEHFRYLETTTAMKGLNLNVRRWIKALELKLH